MIVHCSLSLIASKELLSRRYVCTHRGITYSQHTKALAIDQARQTIHKDLLASVCHLVFFGTPHQGASSVAEFLNSLGAAVTRARHSSVLRELDLWPRSLIKANAMFVDIAESFTVTTFFEKEETYGIQEGLPLTFMPRILTNLCPSQIMDEGSARLNKRQEQVVGLNGNHFEICKLRTTNDPMYRMYWID